MSVLAEKLLAAIALVERSNCFGPAPIGYIVDDKAYAPTDVQIVFKSDDAERRKAVLRICAAHRRILARHKPDVVGVCENCFESFPCEDVSDLARGYGLEVEQ